MSRIARLLIAAPLVLLTGCVERLITVTSEPPGAVVWLNDVEIGRTPVQTEFTFYGTYDVRLRLEGYEPLHTSRHASSPIYDYPGLDLIAEAIPTTIESRIEWHFELTPLPERAEGADRAALNQELIQRAREVRGQLSEPAKK
jgi:hypothetical protein